MISVDFMKFIILLVIFYLFREFAQARMTPEHARSPDRGWNKLDSTWNSDSTKVPSNEASGEDTGEVRQKK